jgi:hypothetical protein
LDVIHFNLSFLDKRDPNTAKVHKTKYVQIQQCDDGYWASSRVFDGLGLRGSILSQAIYTPHARIVFFDLPQAKTKVTSCLTYAYLPLILGYNFEEHRRRFVAILKDRGFRR